MSDDALKLFLAGDRLTVTRKALLNFKDDLERAKKKDTDRFGIDTAEHDGALDAVEDVLEQLGWKPKGGSAEAVTKAGDGQMDLPLSQYATKDSTPEEKIAACMRTCLRCSGARFFAEEACPSCNGSGTQLKLPEPADAPPRADGSVAGHIGPAADAEPVVEPFACMYCAQTMHVSLVAGVVECEHCNKAHTLEAPTEGGWWKLSPLSSEDDDDEPPHKTDCADEDVDQ